jgi:hypothetical protein
LYAAEGTKERFQGIDCRVWMVGPEAMGLHVAGHEGDDSRNIFSAIREFFEDGSHRLYSSDTVSRIL